MRRGAEEPSNRSVEEPSTQGARSSFRFPPPASRLRPATVCQQLLQATDAAEGRRKRRKRNTTPDALGMEVKRELLEAAVAEDPAADEFEAWLFARVPSAGGSAGATRAMALQIWDEWRFALTSGSFREWLAAGAPSDDTRPGADLGLDLR